MPPMEALVLRRPFSRPLQSFGTLHADLGELVVALRVAPGNGDLDDVAGANIGVALGVFEIREGNDAFGFVTDVDEDGLARHRHDRALQAFAPGFRPVLMRVLVLLEDIAERDAWAS